VTPAHIILSLAELEAFDPHSREQGRERRFCCPLPACADKRKTPSHRSLAMDTRSGAWLCHRCGETGKLREFWQEQPREVRRQRSSLRYREPTLAIKVPSWHLETEWRQHLKDVRPLLDTPGSSYLHDRGISVGLSHLSGVRYSPDWFGRPAVLFPVRDRAGQLVAAQGRYLDDRSPKMRSAGAIGRGVFATPDAWEADTLILVEAPCCALTLALAGFSAIALLGARNCPDWLPSACAFKRILIGLDGDATGDAAAVRLADKLCPFAAGVERLRPVWFKDWNELAPRLPEGLKAALQDVLAR
jgi:hypothetical protein